MEGDFVGLEQVLPLGKTIIKVRPKMGRYDKSQGTFVDKDVQAGGFTARGNQYWSYITDVPTGKKSKNGNEIMCSITAFKPEEKALLDSGEVELNMVDLFMTPEGKYLPLDKITKLGLKPQKIVDNDTGEIKIATKRRYYINKCGREQASQT